MLSQPATPRARPPASSRRSSSLKFKHSPPPPYAAKFTFPAVSPEASTSNKRLSGDWTHERSREELEDLLVHAGSIIHEREQDLDMTSSMCKRLAENNLTLKSKHEALLARIPSSQSTSPENTPVYYTSSLPRSTTEGSLVSGVRGRHTRRISFLPADIALLSDQNAELAGKLEQLESESAATDLAGRRKLKKLEKEIQGLRDELDSTHAKSEELERKVRADEAVKRKVEREVQVSAARERTRTQSGEGLVTPDFAPPNFVTKPASPIRESEAETSSEEVLVSQLLQKIEELEETNAQITSQQVQTASRFQEVQRDAENISRVYECLGDDTEGGGTWEMVVDDDHIAQPDVNQKTIRFRSLRRTLEHDFGDVFGDGVGGHSTIRTAVKPFSVDDSPSNFDNLSGMHRSRRSVVGLFDSSFRAEVEEVSPTLSRGMSLPPILDQLTPESQCSELPEMSPLSAFPLHTLGSELGSEIGEEDGLGGAPYRHFRTDSLYDISRAPTNTLMSPEHSSPQQPPVTARSSSGATSSTETVTANPRLKLEPPTPGTSLEVDYDGGSISKHRTRYRRMSQTVRSRTTMWVDGRFTEKLPTPTKVKRENKKRDSGILERGFGGLSGLSAPAIHRRVSSASKQLPLPESIANALDAVLERFAGAYLVDGENELEGDEEVGPKGTIELHASSMSVAQPKAKGTEFVLEVWLWLQFAIIVLLFLWAMAKRGPRNVLAEAEGQRRKGGVVRRG